MLTFYLYILRCNDGSYYIGHTDNLEKRFYEHSIGICCNYTKKRLPVKLVFTEEFANRYEALERERQIKRWSRAKKEALIEEDWEKIKQLARGCPSTGSGRTKQQLYREHRTSKQLLTITVALLFCLSCTHTIFANIDIKKQDEIKEAEVWVKLERLQEAEDLISDGKVEDARIILNALIEQYPDYGAAKELIARSGTAPAKIENTSDDNRKKADRAYELWQEFLRFKGAGHIEMAREKLLDINEIYGQGDVRPQFLDGSERELTEIEARLEKALEEQFTNIGSELSRISGLVEAKERLVSAVALYGQIGLILSRNKNFAPAVSLRTKISEQLDKSARVMFASASTLKKLEGCEAAQPRLQKLLELLQYPDISFYQMTKVELKNCEKKGEVAAHEE